MLILKRLFAIAALASKDTTRTNLAAVFAEREANGRPRLTATNGHALVTVTWPEPDHQACAVQPDMRIEPTDGFTVLIPAAAWQEASKNLSANRNGRASCSIAFLEEAASSERLRLTATDGEMHRTITTRRPEESFPDYRAMWPDPERVVVRIGLGAELLANLLTTIDAMAGRRTAVELLIPADPTLPVELRAHGDNDEEIRALCMPVRLDQTSATTDSSQELRVVLAQLDRIVTAEDFCRHTDLHELLSAALAQLTIRLGQTEAARKMCCASCQQPAEILGDCGNCRTCCLRRCTHADCSCFQHESTR